MSASFPWYDLPSVQWANDALWRAMGYTGELIRHHSTTELWHDPQLLITQACGLDLFLSNAPIEPFAAPVFDLECSPGTYFSYIVGNPLGDTAAVNALSSHSGYSALLSNRTPNKIIVTGSHQASLKALQDGVVEVAAIDAVTWHMIKRDSPDDVAGITIASETKPTPAPPFVVRRGVDSRELFGRLKDAVSAPQSSEATRALMISDVMQVTRQDYQAVLAEYQAVTDTLSDR